MSQNPTARGEQLKSNATTETPSSNRKAIGSIRGLTGGVVAWKSINLSFNNGVGPQLLFSCIKECKTQIPFKIVAFPITTTT